MKGSIGILGGGQLGQMLYLAGIPLDLTMHVMDSSREFPAGKVCPNFVEGDFKNFSDVVNFGKTKDIITIEIEQINVEALKELVSMGKQVYPQPEIIEMIQDKGKQKVFYARHGISSSAFRIFDSKFSLEYDLANKNLSYPFIQKLCVGGYDGRGVQMIRNEGDMKGSFKENFLVEDVVSIEKEISVLVCRGQNGDIAIYDPVEMIFDTDHHILKYQLGPAELTEEQVAETRALGIQVAKQLQIVGILAIEMFLDSSGHILVNEVAPRPHNSGHHTIEASVCSQYENHLRAITGIPLGTTTTLLPSLMLNVLGEPDISGPVQYHGMDDILAMDNVHVHLYGKKDTRPYRKMGHITILDSERDKLVGKYRRINTKFKATA